MVSLRFNKAVHAIDDDCDDYHCAYHDVDEAPSRRKGAIRCGECWHMYSTARDLRQVFRREVVGLVRTNWLRKMWLKARVRVKDIYFCPYCIHDF